jgi:hypothetical protein
MFLSAIFCTILIWQLYKTVSFQRKLLVIGALCFYLILTFGDLVYLDHIYNRAFHFSDPGDYYDKTKHLLFFQVVHFDGTNTFYPIINWIYNHLYENPWFVSGLLKIANILVFLSAYAILTKKIEKINYIDFLILLNPFLLMIIIRNVRDMYILFFVVLILVGFGVVPGNRLSKPWTLIGLIGLATIRPVLLFPVLCVWWVKNRHIFSKLTQLLFYSIVIAVTISQFHTIIRILGNQMISALDYINEDVEAFLPLLEGNLSPQVLIQSVSRIFIGLISFVFTPHPVNFFSEWQTTMDINGTTIIYTGLDNLLIVLGSIVNYLMVLPILVACAMNYKRLNQSLLLYISLYAIIYVTMFMGITDIRNRYPVIFLGLFMFQIAQLPIKIRPLHYGITLCIGIGLMLLKSS